MPRGQDDPVIRPLEQNSRVFYVFMTILLVLIGWFLYAWYYQLRNGLVVTGMRTPVGAAWGVYISNFVFFACMAHGGMAVSAAVRLLKLNDYKVIARMGEVVTAVCILLAGLSIVIDLGRPDHAINMILYWPERIGSSPLTWDMTVIILYFTLSVTYLWMTMRKDLLHYVDRFEKRGWIYRVLLIGYNPDQEPKIERTAWWLSIAVLILIVMLSGGVIPWIFGLQSGRPGWFGSMAGPYFLTAALATSLGAVIIIAIILRRIYRWQAEIKPEIIRGLGTVFGVLTHLYIYMTIAEQITMRFSSTHGEEAVSELLIQGKLAPIFWTMFIGGLAIPATVLVLQGIKPKLFNMKVTMAACIVLLAAFWVKRFLIVVPSLLRPLMPFTTGSYQPSWVEWSVIVGSFAIAIFLYTLFLKIFPIVELHDK